MPERVVVGTRGSKLALAQAEKVIGHLKRAGKEVKIQIIKTSGDIMKDKPLYEFKGAGAFVRTIDEALADGEIDIAVHSMKDIPVQRVENTVIAAVLQRESPFDAFISASGERLEDLDSEAIIGTSSLRRSAQIKRLRSDVIIKNIRGNLDTRLRKLREGEYDAIIVGEAGLIRLGIDDKINYQRLSPELFVPSANQGIIAVVTRKGEEDLVSFMNHRETMLEASVEREILKELGIGCAVPAGIYAKYEDGSVRIICEILTFDGEERVRIERKLDEKVAHHQAKEVALEVKEKIGEIQNLTNEIKENR
jgi:hydroxymethylbilane synthase